MYASLSPKKKRAPSSDDETFTSPKKIRTALLATPSKTTRSHTTSPFLPAHLTRIQTLNSSLQHALSLALASSAVSPSVDTGRVPNVLNHISLASATGFTVTCDVEDIKRLCWIWEWDGTTLPSSSTRNVAMDNEDNPFLVPKAPSDWVRGGMGLIITPTTHFVRSEGKRIPAYGIGIEVDMDLTEGKGGGMAAVARWTAEGESRRRELYAKLQEWVKLHNADAVPRLPLAALPILPMPSKQSSLTRLLSKSVDSSPVKGESPPSDSSPGKSIAASRERALKEFAVSFPITPQTPATSPGKSCNSLSPETPTCQTGPQASTVPQTPTTSRRAAIYERIRQKSLTSTPSISRVAGDGAPMSKDKMRLLGQEELKRRCLLGRLDEVAATIWALFSCSAQNSSMPLSMGRKRRTMQRQEVVRALVSSASLPASISDAGESIKLLSELCPFFLRPLVIAGEDWLEMPYSSPRKEDSGEEVLKRSPKTVKAEQGGLREVRERIRKELESNSCIS